MNHEHDTPRMVADYCDRHRQYRRRRSRWWERDPSWLMVIIVGALALGGGYFWAWDAERNRRDLEVRGIRPLPGDYGIGGPE